VVRSSGARDAYIDIDADASLVLKFDLGQAERAARVMRALSTKSMYLAITNLRGELRSIARGGQVPSYRWVEELGN